MGSLALVSAVWMDLDRFLSPVPVTAFFGFPSELWSRGGASKNKSRAKGIKQAAHSTEASLGGGSLMCSISMPNIRQHQRRAKAWRAARSSRRGRFGQCSAAVKAARSSADVFHFFLDFIAVYLKKLFTDK